MGHLVFRGGFPGTGWAMSSTAASALERAAERARRRIDLELAKALVEKHLVYEITAETTPWVSVLFHVSSGGLLNNQVFR